MPAPAGGGARPVVGVLAGAVVLALALGALTALAQGRLPEHLASLANSSGSWALVAFALALLARGPRTAAAVGASSLLALLAGYVVLNAARGFPSSGQLMVFWTAAGLLAGPLLGLGATWVRHRGGVHAALGVAAISGVLVGEGVYGLRYVAETTSPPYWSAQVVVGVALLVAVAARRLRTARDVAVAVVSTAATAAAFVAVYSGDLMLLFS